MELWIRSQDRRTLRKVSDLYLNPIGCLASKDELYWITDGNVRLEGYKTEERALEVLGKIQNKIIELDRRVVHYDLECVYQMPKD